eukprot:6963218-Alexandrium_andersonii.AAC.1
MGRGTSAYGDSSTPDLRPWRASLPRRYSGRRGNSGSPSGTTTPFTRRAVRVWTGPRATST